MSPNVWIDTNAFFEGPWLLDAEKLTALDKLIADEWPKLVAHHKALCDEKLLPKKAQYPAGAPYLGLTPRSFDDAWRDETGAWHRVKRPRCKLHIECENDLKIDAQSFEEARRQINVREVIARRFTLELEAGNVTCTIESSLFHEGIRVKVNPQQEPIARDLFGALRNFFENHEERRMVRGWRYLHPIPAILSGLGVLGLIPLARRHIPVPYPLAHEAEEFLKAGIGNGNEAKAIELLLRMQAATPPEDHVVYARWFPIALIAGILLTIALACPPGVELAIGRGVERIKRERFLIRALYVAIPGYVVGSFVLPAFTNYVSA